MNQSITKNLWVKRILVLGLSYISTLSLAKIISLGNDSIYYGGLNFGYNITAVAVFAVTAFVLNRFLLLENRRLKVVSSIGGVLMGMAIVYGSYVHFMNDIFISRNESLLQIGTILGISVLTTPLFCELFLALNKAGEWFRAGGGNRKELPSQKQSVRFFLLSWLGIFASYVPLFLQVWPGNFCADAPYQMIHVITNTHYTHHPLAHTLLMGWAYKLGVRMGNVSAGYQLYTLIQMLVLSAAFAYATLYIYNKVARKCIWIATLGWAILFPMHMVFAVTSTKDVLFGAFFLFSMVFLVRYFVDKEVFKWYSYVGMILSIAGALLYRNNMWYVVILGGVITIFLEKGWKNRLRGAAVLLASVLLFQGVNESLIRYTNASESDVYRESMSVPLQCLARVVSYHVDDLDPELYDEICMYIREEAIPNYNPYISDPIKNYASEEMLKTNTGNFMKLFLKVGLQFPDEYFESIVTNTMGYWYPLHQAKYVGSDIATYHMLIGMGEELVKKDLLPGGEFLDYLFWEQGFREIPILGYLFRNVCYIWLYVIYFLWCILQKKRSGWVPGVFGLIYILTCFAGPMTALRYIYCLVTTVPIIMYILISRNTGEQPKEM